MAKYNSGSTLMGKRWIKAAIETIKLLENFDELQKFFLRENGRLF